MGKPEQVIPEQCIGFKLDPVKTTISAIDAIIYQIGIGYGQDPMNEAELPYVYEMHEDFAVFPTNVTVSRGFELFELLVSCPGLPTFNPMRLLHGENKVEIFKSLDIDTPYLNVAEISDVTDKVKGALVEVALKTYEEADDGTTGDLVLVTYIRLFIRGIGGFGFKGKNQETPISVPKTQPTKTSS